MCSRTLQSIQVREIGLLFAADDLSPFLKMGVTWARHHSNGSLPVCRERSKITCMMGAISSRNSFSRTGLSLSGPAAFPGLRFFKSLLYTSNFETRNSL